jgi:ankyrin repeat protein
MSGPGSWQTPLIAAAERGDMQALEAELQGDTPVDFMEAGWTALRRAIQAGQPEAALRLIQAGARADQKTPGGYTPLYWAAQRGLVDVVRALLAAGAPVDAQELEDGKTPLTVALLKAHGEVVGALLEAGASLEVMTHSGVTPLEAAALSVSIRKEPRSLERAQQAAARVQEAAARTLKEAAALPPDSKEVASALRLAAGAGDAEAVRALLAAGAPPDAPNGWNTAALSLAAIQGHDQVVALLLERGARPGRVTRRMLLMDRLDLYDALGWAVTRGHASVVRALASHGVPVDEGDPWGVTPLMRAAFLGFAPVVEVLLEAGADPARRNRRGQTAAQIAQGANHVEVARRLTPA